MDILQKKVSDEEVISNQIEGVSHEWYGKPSQLQALFDRLCKFLIGRYNSLIDLLSSNDGASNINTTSGKSVQDVLLEKADIKNVYTKEEAQQAITDRIIHTGNGNMLISIYDWDGDGVVEFSDRSWDSNKLGGKLPSEYALANQVAREIIHTTTEDAHTLTGDFNHFYFKAIKRYTQGEAFTLNGDVVQVVNNFNQPLGTDAFKIGDIVFGFLSEGKIHLNTRRVPYRLWNGSSYSNVLSVPNIALFDYISLSDSNVSLCRLAEQGSDEQMEVTFTSFFNGTMRSAFALMRHSAEDEITVDSYSDILHSFPSGHNSMGDIKVLEIWGY